MSVPHVKAQILLQPGETRESPEKLAQEKEQIAGQTQQMERDLQRAVRDTAGQRDVSSKLRDALGELQLEAGAHQEATNTIRQIIALNPDGVEDYRKLLMQLGG